uniref:F2J6.14 protein n=1 Tax=Arabidopsis thaliana TaxID=3702 RepID=Q9MA67_ARATH|nr:Similar to reverse transcriptase [Arabidopsis thaliana]
MLSVKRCIKILKLWHLLPEITPSLRQNISGYNIFDWKGRVRSRSKKRSSSTPPRLITSQNCVKGKNIEIVPSTVLVEAGQSYAKGSAWVKKSTTGVARSPVKPPESHLPESVLVSAIPSEDSFPYPPGWGAMSSKSRKRWRHKWNISRSSAADHISKILVGDFDQIAATSDHYSVLQTSIPMRGLEEFQNCLRDSDLVDIPSRGVHYTWSNHQDDNPIIRKLDRAIANGDWFSSFPSAIAVFELSGVSDHSPCIIILENLPKRSKKCFRYFSFLSTHPTFLVSLTVAWEEQIPVGSHMFSLGEHLKAAKKCCKLLNRQGFGNIQHKTKEALDSLESIQSQLLTNPSDSLFRVEHVARKKWNFFAAALESFYRQKSRIKWLQDGDANTRFFHKVILANQAKNLIKFLRMDDDVRVENVTQVKEMIVAYYTHLLGSDSDILTPDSVQRIKDIHPFRCNDTLASRLSALPSDKEITAAVFAMPRNKAPGPDSFTAEFFWESWFVVKDSTIAAVKEFFRTGHLLKRPSGAHVKNKEPTRPRHSAGGRVVHLRMKRSHSTKLLGLGPSCMTKTKPLGFSTRPRAERSCADLSILSYSQLGQPRIAYK